MNRSVMFMNANSIQLVSYTVESVVTLPNHGTVPNHGHVYSYSHVAFFLLMIYKQEMKK